MLMKDFIYKALIVSITVAIGLLAIQAYNAFSGSPTNTENLYMLYAALTVIAVSLLIGFMIKSGTHKRLLNAVKNQRGAGNSDFIAEYRKDAKSLKYIALLPELLSVSLTLAWAWSARENSTILFSLIFCGGFIGFLWLKAVSVPGAIRAMQARHSALAAVLSFAAIGSLLMLLITSVFDASNTSDQAALQRLEASKPAMALDQQIENARARLDALSAYSDASKAQADQQAADDQRAANQAERARLQSQLASLSPPSMPADMARYMAPDCSPKRNAQGQPYSTRAAELCPGWQAMQADYLAQRDAIQGQLSALGGGGVSAGYATKHAEYLGVQSHLETLLQQRAALSGDTVQAVWRKEDRIIADWLGITPDQANSVKWLIFAICFDFLGLLARIGSALMLNIAGGDPNSAARKKFNAMVASGIDPTTAAGLVGGGGNTPNAPTVPNVHPAKVSTLDDALRAAPALDTGGFIEADGIAHLHKGELVLTAAQTAEYLAERRAKAAPTTPAYATPPANAEPADHYASVNNTPAYQYAGVEMPRVNTQAYADNRPAPDFFKPVMSHKPTPPAAAPHGVEFVAPELSGKQAAGRVGKCDHCVDCGAVYQVTAHNKIRCNECSQKTRANYSQTTAKAKAKKG